jgi:tetratricopeptide (TPR) repeat protein/predicted Ser/Thr protein kinase
MESALGLAFSHYRIVEKLGEGGMGVVYLAEDTLLGRRVAIKFPTAAPANRQRLLAEARAASSLNHPNIAAVYDCGEYEDHPYVVMEFVEGQNLSELLREGPAPAERAVEIAAGVAAALEEAHGRGIIHRDIKPSNIQINERGAVKVVDFGLAKDLRTTRAMSAGAGTVAQTLTAEGLVVGTPYYMSPEQARGESGDQRSDLFSLGAVLYECLTGRRPFEGTSAIEVLSRVLQVEPELPSGVNRAVPAGLDRITRKALAKDPADRYQSARERLDALEAARRKPSAGARISPRLARRAAVALAAIVLGAAGWAVARHNTRAPSAEALRWYEEGANAIRDGTYYKASKALDRAASLDKGFALAHARLAEASNELDDSGNARQQMLEALTPSARRTSLSRTDGLTIEAISRTLTYDYAGAAAIYREVLRQAPAADRASAQLDLGRAYEKNEQPGLAVSSYLEAIRLSPQYAAAFLRLGVLYGRRQEQEKSAEAFRQAEARYAALSNIEGQAETLYERSVIANKRGNLAEAAGLLERAAQMARAAGNQNQQIVALLQLSNLSQKQGDLAGADKLANEAIELARSSGLDVLAARCMLELGNTWFVRGDFAQAGRWFEQSLEYSRRFKAQRSEARALLSLGSLRIQKQELEEGTRNVEQALPFFERGGYAKETSQALILLGRARRDLGDYAGARRVFNEQLARAEKAGDWTQTAMAQEGLAGVLQFQERYPEALAHARECVSISKAHGDQLLAAYGQALTAAVFTRLGRYGEAREALGEVAAAAKRPGGYAALAKLADRYEAELALSERRFADSRGRIRKLVSAPEQLYGESLVEAKRILGSAEVFSGARREGLASAQEALDLARRSAVPRLVSSALLSQAEALAESGESAQAMKAARASAEQSGRTGQQESEARAWLVAARAARASADTPGSRDYAIKATQSFTSLQQNWSAGDRSSYNSRPDVQQWRRQIQQLTQGETHVPMENDGSTRGAGNGRARRQLAGAGPGPPGHDQ